MTRPNILMILIDDMGFGASSSFGGPCEMPTAERLAEDGLRYTRFHTTALCSPTRASLLTGRNHHSCGMGVIPEMATREPGYDGSRPPTTATVARLLQQGGYATGAFGKMHQTPPWELTPQGPFDRWPTGEGFDHFYGFLGAETNQFVPHLYRGTTPVPAPRSPEEGYHLSEDLCSEAIAWTRAVEELSPDKPWFCYLSFGACHTPFHVPEEWRDVYRGRFLHGWDHQRQLTLATQKRLGVIPEDAELPPMPDGVPRWSDLTSTEKEVSQRLMELYAAFAEHTDAQVGRVVRALEERGQLDNTVVIYILGDNGASAEGGMSGSSNYHASINMLEESAEDVIGRLPALGGPDSYPHYPVGWALAMDTPYQWAKQVASHYGGTRNGMIVHWPSGIEGRGELRHQWHHCIDIAPTLLEVAGVEPPSVVDGFEQRPIEGTSIAYTFNEPDAADRRRTQYFEMFGNRGVYHDGWTAVTKHRTPWESGRVALPPFAEDVWELYHDAEDWTQSNDLARERPDVLAALQERFESEAAKYQVFPLDDRGAERLNPAMAGRKSIFGERRSIVLGASTPALREDVAPNVKNVSFSLDVSLVAAGPDDSGVLVAQGGQFGGWSLYVDAGILTYCHNLCGRELYVVAADRPLPGGCTTVRLDFAYDGGALGAGGVATLSADGVLVGQGRVDATVPFFYSLDETLDIAVDRGTPVAPTCGADPSNRFTGEISHVTFTLGDDRFEPAHIAAQRRAHAMD